MGKTMINPAPLQRAIDGATTPVYPSSFSEIARGFKEKFTPRTWTSELAKQWSGTSDKHSAEYKTALRNVQRYEKGTHNPENARAASKAALEKAGQTLPPVRRDVPGKGLTFQVNFTAPGDRGHSKRERSFTVQMSSIEAFQFVNAPSYDVLFDSWFDGGAEAYGDEGAYEAENVSVYAA